MVAVSIVCGCVRGASVPPKRSVMVAEPGSPSEGYSQCRSGFARKPRTPLRSAPLMHARSATRSPARPRAAVGPDAVAPILALIAALLLALAELSTIASVDVVGGSCEVLNDSSPELADRCDLSGWERHGGALILLALVAAGAAAAAWSSLGAAAARDGLHTAAGAVLVAIGAVALAITLIADLPETNETGAIGFDFDGATASAGLGFYLELTGGVLCLLAGILALVPALRARSAARRAGGGQRRVER